MAKMSTQYNALESDVDGLMRQWGAWARQSPLKGLLWPPAASYAHLCGGGVALPAIDDDTALVVDKALSQYAQFEPEVVEAVLLFYISKWPSVRIAEELRQNPRAISGMIRRGLNYVCGVLHPGFHEQ